MTTTTASPAPARARAAEGGRVFAGAGTLLRFNLRRDRIRIPVWVFALFVASAGTANNVKTLYPTAADRASIARSSDTPAVLAMTGPRHYLEDYTFGAMLGHRMLGIAAVLVALMSVLIVTRHTRAEEETGRAELVRSAVVGRHAHLAAALATAAVANLGLALLLAVGLGGMGIEGIGFGGALLYGLAHASVGLVFAGVAAITVQLTAHSRGASGMALAAIGAAFALRASGDVGNQALSWFSPIGWAQRTYVFVDDRWWPLLLSLVLAGACTAVGFRLSTRRDVGAGLRAARTGPAAASEALSRPFGFALRLHRGLLIGFGVGVFLLGTMYGSILGDAEDMLKDIEQVQDALKRLGGATVAESFAAMVMSIVAVVVAVYAVIAALRARAEETAGRAEPVLATGLSRAGWLGSHLAVAMAGGTLLLLVSGIGLGISGAGSTGDGGLFLKLVGAALAYAPALWVTVGVTAALHGWFPRAAAVAWVVPVSAFAIGYLGQLLQFPGWVNNLSPFGHVPRLPAAGMDWTPMAVLTLVAAGLVWLGLEGFRRRDLDTK
ncbi:ABC transporter permease [Streptomyces venezuelae]|uniref:ABC transporter permease n=1 Tax=Streptomyces venezuelae TaxID=54571 RepID=A0A5P2D7X8_STRVZ|nr:ABC transporter permease [Streptomyces venezuelae]